MLTRTGLATRRLALVATTCPKCGTVGVYWNGVLLRKVSLVSPTYQNKKLLYVQLFSAVVTGNVTVKTLTNQVVYVDGCALRRASPAIHVRVPAPLPAGSCRRRRPPPAPISSDRR